MLVCDLTERPMDSFGRKEINFIYQLIMHWLTYMYMYVAAMST